MKALLFALIALGTSLSHAAVLGKCDGLDTIANLAAPTRSLPNAAKLAAVQQGYEETSLALLVFTYGDDDYYQCASIKPNFHPGFSDLDLAHAKVVKQGDLDVYVAIPAKVTDEASGKTVSTVLKIKMHEEFPAAKVTLL